MSDAAADARAERGGLTFEWRRGAGRPFWLLFFLLASVVLHAAAFYLFRVVYPPQKRELLKSFGVTVLDPADPTTRDVLSRIDDRVVAFDARSSFELPGVAPAESAVRFVPFFQDYEPALRELPPPDAGGGLQLFPPGRLFLPPPDGARSAPLAPVETLTLQPVIELRWEGVGREVLQDFVWNPATPPARPEDTDRSVLTIGIDRFGRVAHALAEQGAGTEMDASIHEAIRAMRFAPKDAAGLDWAWVTVRW